jgi:outer membrane protein assembly factor BamA
VAELEAQGFRIGSIHVRELPIFEAGADGELPALYRLANDLHVDTRDRVIESQLLFRAGEPVSVRLFEETERNLRELRYIREPSVRAIRCHDHLADIEVAVQEVWTTNPGISFGRSGGENAGGIKLQELNVLGLGKQLTFELAQDADRSYYTLHWRDPGVRGSRWITDVALRESNDGQGWSVMAERPFYALDSRWSARLALQQDETVDSVYRLGERVAGYDRQADFAELSYGRSDGLLNGWTRRTTFGLRREHADFGIAPDEPAPGVMPEDRRLDYPFLRFEGVQDDFETTRNRDQISRTEDERFGLRYALEVGWSTPALGADRDALLLHAEGSRGWRVGLDDTMFADAALTTRVEHGAQADGLLSGSLRYYRPTGPRGVFFAGFTAGIGHDLDADHELTIGGDNGLRGYPLRYQAGSATALVTLEQRLFSKHSLWQLADLGAAVFFDMGRAWGEPRLGPGENLGLLKDVGIGLRLASSRSALGNVVHIDVAFPLDGSRAIDDVQFLVQTKGSF